MKIIGIILLVIVINPCLANAQKDKNNEILFAEINNESYNYKIDTLDFKKSISKSLFSKESKGSYDKIEIKKSKTIGDINEVYYAVILHHYGKNLKTSRYLKKSLGKLYLSNENPFVTLYNSCIGIEKKCSPNIVLSSDLEMGWICSDKVGVCSIDDKECRSIKSVILD